MVMVARVRVEIRPAGLDDDLVQQPGIGKLVERVVYGSKRHSNARRESFAVQLLGCHVTIAIFEQ